MLSRVEMLVRIVILNRNSNSRRATYGHERGSLFAHNEGGCHPQSYAPGDAALAVEKR
jgi:hypothetical protein